MGLSVRGALLNWSDQDLVAMLKREDGSKLTPREAKERLLDQLAQGHEKIPMGECDNWDWKEGCLGHEKKEAE